MSKRTALSLLFVAAALLITSAAFADVPSSASDQAFLASLQAPAPAAPEMPGLSAVNNEPAPIPMSCTYQCQKCGTNKVKLCSLCNGVASCEPCHSGTVCSI